MPRQLEDIEVTRLVNLYAKVEKELTEAIDRALIKGNQTEYLIGMKKNAQEILISLSKGSKTWCETAIPRVYTFATDEVDKQVGKLQAFGGIHQQAAQVLADSAFGRMEDLTNFIGRRVDDIYRVLALENMSGSVVGYKSWQQVARQYRKNLAEKGITGFQDRAGRDWNMKSYTEMVARTTTMEAHLEGTKNRILEHGYDLVKITTHPGSCEKCLPYEGKVLSLSGKTPGYPTLAEAKAKGLFHPRCKHAYGLKVDLDAEIVQQSLASSASDWKDVIKDRIEQCKKAHFYGVEGIVNEVGGIINQESLGELLTEYRPLSDKFEDLTQAILKADKEGNYLISSELREDRYDLTPRMLELRQEAAQKIYSSLKEVRKFGGSCTNIYGDKEVIQAVDNISEFFPSSWVTKSNSERRLTAQTSDRGYFSYFNGDRNNPFSVISLSGKPGTANMDRCALHEFSHRMEVVVPYVRDMERAFYYKRTSGQALEVIPGTDAEYTKKDKFINPYMGKDYNEAAFEILSMGMESLFFGTNDILKDPDYLNFIVGVLATI